MTKTSIYSALAARAGFSTINDTETETQLRVLGRCPPERFNFLVLVIHALLKASNNPEKPWTCDVSKKYMVSNDRVFYAWRIVFQGANLSAQYADIVNAINAAPRPARIELDSQLLPGAQPGVMRGGVNERGKGSSVGGSAPMVISTAANRRGIV